MDFFDLKQKYPWLYISQNEHKFFRWNIFLNISGFIFSLDWLVNIVTESGYMGIDTNIIISFKHTKMRVLHYLWSRENVFYLQNGIGIYTGRHEESSWESKN